MSIFEIFKIVFVLSFLKKIAGHSFVAPFYHTVSDEPLPHVQHLYLVKTIQQFKEDLAYLLKHFKPIALQALHQYIEQHAQLPKNTFFLSFDDGFAECATIIAPILKQQGIPATFFINSAFIDNKQLMYRCKASLLINQLINEENPKDTLTFRAQIMETAYFDSKTLDYVSQQLNINFNTYLETQKPYLSTPQINSLHQQGFSIGSHSVDHPWFRELDFYEQQTQITRSLATLRRFLQLVNSFSFPFSDDGITTSLLDFIYNQNIALTFACAGVKEDETLKHIQRLAMEVEQTTNKQLTKTAAQLLPKALLTYRMKKFIHKHKVSRPSSI